ncbi:reverse transcriptase (RNA-dependent DNA polymerase) domain-containing protein [Cordyceps javanica]|nr:reverse transcriptase (RNA-dependent DNA polymerase) domain-containing protein [Cordyceps javanica]
MEVATTNRYGIATNNASTLAELISTIPQSWRPSIGAYLTTIYRAATKLANVQNTIAAYQRHTAEKSFPASIKNSVKDPKIQFSKEYLGTTEGSLAGGSIKDQVLEAQKNILKRALMLKEEELAALQSVIKFDRAAWRREVVDVASRTATAYGVTFKYSLENDAGPEWSGNAQGQLQADCKGLWAFGDLFHYRAVAIARSLADRSLIEKTRNLNMKKKTDQDKMDIDSEKPTKELIDDSIKAFESRLKTDLARMMGTSPGKRRGGILTSDRQFKKTRQQKQPQQERQAEQPFSRQEREAPKERPSQETRVMTLRSFMAECSKDFRPWLIETYPCIYGSLSSQTRIKIDFAFMRPWEIDTLRVSKPGVFKHPDVVIPDDIEYMLAVNHKFILHQRPEQHDVDAAKQALVRSVRNKWLFRDNESSEFIPKFHVPNKRWRPPLASRPIEQGLEAAMAVIDSQVRQALTTIATRPPVKNLNWTKVQEYLSDQGLIAKLTDKNLGLAVLPISWYDAQCLQLLADSETYKPVFDVPIQELIDTLYGQLSSWRLPPAMDKYIRQRTLREIPEFHAIPKVHKKPWKLRPIVPSHSWVTTTTSTVLDHLCQPLLENFPWIVASSKQVINQIEKVKPLSGKPVWILTADVVAFYTNIPPKQCSNILAGWWRVFGKTSAIPYQAIRKMARFVMQNNYLSYQGQAFHQLNGLAMGTSCAPVVANLYAAWFEKKARVVHQEGVLLYVRYIDDILCLFQGTKEEVQNFVSGYTIGPLSLTWSINRLRNEFLDIELIQEPGLTQRVVHTRLFRKTMNRHLYIPWSSAHPLHVKKGFVKAELTRYIILCSKFEHFADARKELYGNLRRRGYPVRVLDEWFIQVSYETRAQILLPKEKKEDRAPLMLSGHYNPVWDFVDVNKVAAAAHEFWLKEKLPSSLTEPLIRSLGRTTSLFDLLSVWNKTNLLSSATVGSTEPQPR